MSCSERGGRGVVAVAAEAVLVGLDAAVLDDHSGHDEAVEQPSLEQLVPETEVERLDIRSPPR